jgi:hypothetical protein
VANTCNGSERGKQGESLKITKTGTVECPGFPRKVASWAVRENAGESGAVCQRA